MPNEVYAVAFLHESSQPTHMNTVQAVEAWLNQAVSRESTGDYSDIRLDPLQQVMQDLPKCQRPVTFAGTKGKGSTQCLLEAVLLAHGQQTVVFTSPHVNELAERWRINGRMIDDAELVTAARIAQACEQQRGLTYFERCFIIACVVAARHPHAHFLLEVGLEGRLDCANVLDCRLALISHIGYDHCDVLGTP